MLCVNWWLMLKTLCWLLQSAQKNACTLTFATDVQFQCIIITKFNGSWLQGLPQRTSIGPSSINKLNSCILEKSQLLMVTGVKCREIALLSWDHASMVNKTCGNDKQHAIQYVQYVLVH